MAQWLATVREGGTTRSESLLLAMDADGPQLVEGENAKLSFSFSAVHTVDPHLFARHLGSISHQFTVAWRAGTAGLAIDAPDM